MRIGIDAHILSPEHHRHHPEIADYTRRLIRALLDMDAENDYTLFVDSRTPDAALDEFRRPNTVFRHFPFAQYRSHLPFVYSHMLVSSILSAARLNVFHSPEGLIPYFYPGRIVATFHWVPTGQRDANVFVKTWMLGARTGFKAFCRRASRILLRNGKDRDHLCELHKYPEDRAVVIQCLDTNAVDWRQHARDVLAVYEDVMREGREKRRRLPRPHLPRLRWKRSGSTTPAQSSPKDVA